MVSKSLHGFLRLSSRRRCWRCALRNVGASWPSIGASSQEAGCAEAARIGYMRNLQQSQLHVIARIGRDVNNNQIMNTTYFPSMSLTRRATVPISPMAQTASLIDPNLEQYTMGAMQHQQLNRNQDQMGMQHQMQTQMQSPMQNNGHLQSPMQNNSVQQLQSPIQNTGHFHSVNSNGNMRNSQSITSERALPAQQVGSLPIPLVPIPYAALLFKSLVEVHGSVLCNLLC